MRRHVLPVMLVFALASACAPFPVIDALGTDAGPSPRLAPIDDLLAEADATSAKPAPSLQARAARLKARAAAIPDIAPPS